LTNLGWRLTERETDAMAGLARGVAASKRRLGPQRGVDLRQVADGLLQRGDALAGTAYQDNGWAIEQGLADVRALTEHWSPAPWALARRGASRTRP
jgi:hypothetical protein